MLWALGCYIRFLGLRQCDVIGRLVLPPSNIFTKCLVQARLELDAGETWNGPGYCPCRPEQVRPV